MLYKYLIYTISNDIYKITVKCYQNFQFFKVIRCLPVKNDGYRSVNIDYRSVNNGYRFFEFELSFRAVSSGFRRFTAGLPIPLVGENRFTVGKVNPAPPLEYAVVKLCRSGAPFRHLPHVRIQAPAPTTTSRSVT